MEGQALRRREPQLGNPVAFCLDEQGRIYVAEEYRFNRGTEENRSRPFLLEDDLRLQTVADRLAMYRKWADRFEGGMAWFSRYSDQVRLLEDRDGDGPPIARPFSPPASTARLTGSPPGYWLATATFISRAFPIFGSCAIPTAMASPIFGRACNTGSA